MKKLFLSFIFLFTINVFSQDTYNSLNYTGNYEPYYLSKANLSQIQNLDFQLKGANVSWDYSDIITRTQSSIKTETPIYYEQYKINWCRLNGIAFPRIGTACNDSFNTEFNITHSSFSNVPIPELGNIPDLEDLNNQFPRIGELMSEFLETTPELEAIISQLESVLSVVNGVNIGGNELRDLVVFYNKDDEKLEKKMYALKLFNEDFSLPIFTEGLPLTISYTDPDILYQFPITYGDVYTNTAKIGFNTEILPEAVKELLPVSFSFDLDIIRKNDVEGYGKLITPYKTYNNTLKIKSTATQSLNFSFLVGDVIVNYPIEDEPNPPVIITTYSWFDSAYGVPVMQVRGFEIGDEFIPFDVAYIDEKKCLEPIPFFIQSPIFGLEFDYENKEREVSFYNYSSNYESVSWDFGDGSEVSTDLTPKHVYKCPGIYNVTLTAINDYCDPNIEKSITLPIFIKDTDGLYTSEVTQNNGILTANRSEDVDGLITTYQWVNCEDTTIVLGTEKVFEPLEDGNYAVILTTGGCENMSKCIPINILGYKDNSVEKLFKIYPNPTKGDLNIVIPNGDSVKSIKIHDLYGKLVGNSLDISKRSAGVYFVTIETTNHAVTKKIIKL